MKRLLKMCPFLGTAVTAVLMLLAVPVQAQQTNVVWVVPDNAVIMYVTNATGEASAGVQIRDFIERIGKSYDLRSVSVTTRITYTYDGRYVRREVLPRSEADAVYIVVDPLSRKSAVPPPQKK